MPDHPSSDAFQTVAGRGHAAFEVRGSAFIGHVRPADTIADAEAFVDEVSAEPTVGPSRWRSTTPV